MKNKGPSAKWRRALRGYCLVGRQGLEPPKNSVKQAENVSNQPTNSPDVDAAGTDAHATTTPGGRESVLVHLGREIAAAAEQGRADVVAELAAIVGRLSNEERERHLERAGVPFLGARLPKRR